MVFQDARVSRRTIAIVPESPDHSVVTVRAIAHDPVRDPDTAQRRAEHIALERHHGLTLLLRTAGVDQQVDRDRWLVVRCLLVEELWLTHTPGLPERAVYERAVIGSIYLGIGQYSQHITEGCLDATDARFGDSLVLREKVFISRVALQDRRRYSSAVRPGLTLPSGAFPRYAVREVQLPVLVDARAELAFYSFHLGAGLERRPEIPLYVFRDERDVRVGKVGQELDRKSVV